MNALIALLVTSAAFPLVTKGINGASLGDISLAVSHVSCSDSNKPASILSGDYTSLPFCTLQAAVNALPKVICYGCQDLITVASSATVFPGANITGFSSPISVQQNIPGGFSLSYSAQPWKPALMIVGTPILFTPLTGSATGTCQTGGTGLCTVAANNLTVNDLKFSWFKITGGTGYWAGDNNLYPIQSNTSGVITLADQISVTTDNTTTYQIVTLNSVLDPDPSSLGQWAIGVNGNNAVIKIAGFAFDLANLPFNLVSANGNSSFVDLASMMAPSGGSSNFFSPISNFNVTIEHCMSNASSSGSSQGFQNGVLNLLGNYYYGNGGYAIRQAENSTYGSLLVAYNFIESGIGPFVSYQDAQQVTVSYNTLLGFGGTLVSLTDVTSSDIEANTGTSTATHRLLTTSGIGRHHTTTDNVITGGTDDVFQYSTGYTLSTIDGASNHREISALNEVHTQ